MAAVGNASAAPSATTLSLSPNTGPEGSALSISGRGFPINTAGTVTLAASRLVIRTRANGTFSADLTVPATTTSVLAVTATVGTVTASASFTVSFAPGLHCRRPDRHDHHPHPASHHARCPDQQVPATFRGGHPGWHPGKFRTGRRRHSREREPLNRDVAQGLQPGVVDC